jgi:hypothetical protein
LAHKLQAYVPLTSDADKGCENAGASHKRAAHCAGHFRFAARAPAMVYGNFENAQARARSFHLHFQIPAVSFLAHAKFHERVLSDGAKRAHVGVTNPVKRSQNESSDASRQDLLEIHAVGFALASRTRANNEIVRAARDWVDKLIHKRGDIAPVAIEKNNDLAFGRKSANARCACASVTAGRSYHARTRFTRALGSAIGAAIIDHDYLVWQSSRETFSYDASDRFLLVQRRDNDGDVAHRKASHALVK